LVRLLSDWSPRRTEFSLFYSSRRHLPVKVRALVDFMRKESKEGEQAGEGRPVSLVAVATADRRRSEHSANAGMSRTGEVIPILRSLTPPPSESALAIATGG
jgi:hypothetical protein